MTRFQSELPAREIEYAKSDFSNLLFAYLQNVSADLSVAISNLANHLKVEASDIDDWLNKEALPCSRLFIEIQLLIRGLDEAQKSSLESISVFICRAENIQALQAAKLTQSKN